MNQYFIAYDVRRKVLMFIRTDRPMNLGDVRKLIPGGCDISKRALQMIRSSEKDISGFSFCDSGL